MTWAIFLSKKGMAIKTQLYGTEAETESAAIIGFLKARDKSAAWWSRQKEYSCGPVK